MYLFDFCAWVFGKKKSAKQTLQQNLIFAFITSAERFVLLHIEYFNLLLMKVIGEARPTY